MHHSNSVLARLCSLSCKGVTLLNAEVPHRAPVKLGPQSRAGVDPARRMLTLVLEEWWRLHMWAFQLAVEFLGFVAAHVAMEMPFVGEFITVISGFIGIIVGIFCVWCLVPISIIFFAVASFTCTYDFANGAYAYGSH